MHAYMLVDREAFRKKILSDKSACKMTFCTMHKIHTEIIIFMPCVNLHEAKNIKSNNNETVKVRSHSVV